MKLDTLRNLFIHELRDLYSAEKQLVAALPKMAAAASHPELGQAIKEHLGETETHVERLETIFEQLEASSRGPKCKGMAGLIEEGKALLEEDCDPDVLDAGLISAAQRVEHYEIAGYGTARAYAEKLGETAIADLLQQTLDEEGMADKTLTSLAESTINADAMAHAGH